MRDSVGLAALAGGLALGAALGLAAGAYAQGAPGQHVIRMAGSAYAPAAVQARRGDVLRFVNDDTENHDVFVPTFGYGIDLGVTRPGQSAEIALRKAGRFRVECVFHPEMTVSVDVAP